jgi:uncharacterized membrane protein HdeD (DUF308 family)
MKGGALAGIVLIVVGVLALVYQGITYTTHENVFKLGPIEANKEERKTIPLPPVIGGIALVAGVALVVAGSRK